MANIEPIYANIAKFDSIDHDGTCSERERERERDTPVLLHKTSERVSSRQCLAI